MTSRHGTAMWWTDVARLPAALSGIERSIDPSAEVAADAVVVGKVVIGPRSRICPGARIEGPVIISADCLIGNNALVRGNTIIGEGCRIGFAVEIKQARLGRAVSAGPQCYIADSLLDDQVYLGAQVRTSNHRLDAATVQVLHNGERLDTGMSKLGCHIGERAALGIQCIVLPGRMVAAGAVFGPRITISRNLPASRYQLRQELESS